MPLDLDAESKLGFEMVYLIIVKADRKGDDMYALSYKHTECIRGQCDLKRDRLWVRFPFE